MLSSFIFSKFVIILVVSKVGASTSADSERIDDSLLAIIFSAPEVARIHAAEIDANYINRWFDIDFSLTGHWNEWKSSPVLSTTALNLALIYGQEEVAMILLDRGANVFVADGYGNIPLHLAIETYLNEAVDKIMDIMNTVEMPVQFFLHKNSFGRTPLHMAVAYQCEAVLKRLLDDGPHPMITDDKGNTALHLAIEEGNVMNPDNIIGIINAAGSTIVNIQNHNGATALHRACSLSIVWGVERLLKKGANPMITDNYGNTALHLAIEMGNPHIIIGIIKAAGPAIVNIQNYKEETALHVAVLNTQVWAVKYLWEIGASGTIKANEKTALQVAMGMIADGGSADVVEIYDLLLRFD